MSDLKFAFRQLLKHPGFTAVAVLTLALGIGATTAIFSVIHGVLLHPYPYSQPGKIWVPGVRTAQQNEIMRPYRQGEFEAMAALPAFSSVMGTMPERSLLSGEFDSQEITAPRLSANAFPFLGVNPILGRTFGPADYPSPGQPEPVTVLSYQLWQRLYAGDPQAIGRSVRLDDRVYTIIGVMPPRFGWWTGDGLWLPLAGATADAGLIFPIARLAPGTDPEVARQQLHQLHQDLARARPASFPTQDFESTLTNYLSMTSASGEMERTLKLLFAAVVFLLLIACANIANLQLARATARMREMAVRLSIGARRGQLVRQLLTESVLLSGLGGAVGLVFAVGITRLMVALMPGFNVPNEARIEINGAVLAFSVGLSVITGVAFGLFPAWQSSRPDLADALKDGSKGSSASQGRRFRSSLVVAEVALSVVLLVGASLTVRSFLALQTVDPGFRTRHLVAVDLMLPASRYATHAARDRFAGDLLERAQRLPGVESANIGNGGTPFGGPSSGYRIPGVSTATSSPLTVNLVAADYFKTLAIALRRGRIFDGDEVRRGDRVAVINETAAQLWPPGENPIGTQFQIDLLAGPPGQVLFPTNQTATVTVIGISADTRNLGLANDPAPAVYLPYTLAAPIGRTLTLRTRGDPATVLQGVRAEVRSLDSLLPLRNVRSLDQDMAFQTEQPRFTMAVFSIFSAVGLALATAGLFSVLSYLVMRRTREIGVRMALGARRGDILRLAMRDGARLAGIGMSLGVVAALAAVRFMAGQIELHDIRPADPVAFGGVLLLLGMVSLAASWFPARRAASVHPMEALRSE